MRPKKAPDVTPEWGAEFLALSTADRFKISQALGVTERTVFNWAKGKTIPSKASADAVKRRLPNRGRT